MNRPSVVTLGLLLARVAAISAEDLTGTVTDALTNTPIRGAIISVIGAAISQSTDATGAYTITGLAHGQYTIRAEAAGYQPQEKVILIGTAAGQEEPMAPLIPLKGMAAYDRGASVIRVTAGSAGNASVFILSTPGGRIAMRSSIGEKVSVLDVTNVAPGKYLWKIQGADNSIVTGDVEIVK